MTTKAQLREQEEAVERLRDWLRPGDEVLCVLRHVSRSGMQRTIDLLKIARQNPEQQRHDILSLGWNAAKALGRNYDRDREGVRVNGVGMDMGFELVYSLSRVLFDDGYALSHRWL